MEYRFVTQNDILVVGMKAQVTLQTMPMKIGKLARQFMPRRHEIVGRVGTHSFSIQDYADQNFNAITPQTTFDKWVAVEVESHNHIPDGMQSFVLKDGDYLVVDYKGSLADFPKLWQTILTDWLPNSKYELDNRPHFEKLPESYNPQNLINEEQVWVPVRLK
ncbi:GyrI-like domain-containing protein [Hanstruepera marina]|uniref:GyrI-like domain-containing protein n=1 Tax=Hanstruepera marina TaxID=2873265 RepID=UPI001CA79E62|nr:GyrI-like domain-containing protein [Hanstruepera marina]